MSAIRDKLQLMLRERSVRSGQVTLTSGKTSDWFVDCKQTVLSAAGHAWVGELMLDAASGFKVMPRAIAGVALGGCPLASAVAHTSFLRGTPLDAVYVRKEAKGHGSERMIEGDDLLPADTPLVILEDVVTTGGSTLKALEALRARPFVIAGVVALIDRLEGGAERISEAGVPFTALFTRRDFEQP